MWLKMRRCEGNARISSSFRILLVFLPVFVFYFGLFVEDVNFFGLAAPQGSSNSTKLTSEGFVKGKNVTVSGASLDSPVEEIKWCGRNHRTVLLKTIQHRIYRSYDAGRTWHEITDIFQVYHRHASEGGLENTAVEIDSIVVSPVDSNIVVIFCNKTTQFISEDAAKTFRMAQHAEKLTTWLFHPHHEHWALLSGWSAGCYGGERQKEDCHHDLYITKNLGKTIDLVAKYVVQYSWGDSKHNQSERVYMTQHTKKKGHQPMTGQWSKDVNLVYTDNMGGKVTTLVPMGNRFLVSNEYIFVVKLLDSEKQTVNMVVSTDGGKSFKLSKISTDVHEKSYTVLDISEGAIMLFVNHDEGTKDNTGNVYVSDASGEHFALSLPRNVRSSADECEFDKVMSLDGIYLANFKEEVGTHAHTGYDSELYEENIIDTTILRNRNIRSKASSTDLIRSVISFDKGGAWYYLKPPEFDSLGKPVECHEDHCSLNLHGITMYSKYAPFYSMESAVGLIMATGNVGSHLKYDEDEINTYLSRDGGLHWMEIHKGAYIYEFGDHGGLLVLADDVHPTSKVIFTWNEGHTWFDFDLGGAAVEVSNIVTDPTWHSLEFLLYGTQGDKGMIYHLDFSTLGHQMCKGLNEAGSENSDYETWSPSDGRGANCILGRHMTYTRRKQSSDCFNGKDFSQPKTMQICPCTQEDYECTTGFTRDIGSLTCVPENPMMATDKCTSSSYILLDAYTKVPGDVCQSGFAPRPVPVMCPPHAPFSSGAKASLFMILFLAVAMSGLSYLSRSPQAKHMFRNYGFSSFGNVPYNAMNRKDGDDRTFFFDNSVYEPELGFIEAEQEEDAPTLVNYTSPHEDQDLLEFDSNFGSHPSRTVQSRLPSDPIPRIAPPPGSSSTEDIGLF